MSWTPDDMPSLAGRTALVTGVSAGGLGHHTALELARHGARVVLAGRNAAKVAETTTLILDQVPDAELTTLLVDLASLDSVHAAAGKAEALGAIDVLVNNAGVMAPAYGRTKDGFETQMGTNHFGPFLLTGLLLPQLVQSGDGRVVTVSSQMHRMARKAPLADPRVERRYLRWPEYADSKLANLLFTLELDRRLRAADLPVRALAAHPGFAATHLVSNGRFGRAEGGAADFMNAVVNRVAQPAVMGAWPLLMAATADLPGGSYCGPAGLGEMRGTPRLVGTSAVARDPEAGRRFWELSEEATGLRYP